MKIWQITLTNGRIISFKGLKAEAAFHNDKLQQLIRINQYTKEITGIIGGEEHTCLLMSLFTPSANVGPEAVERISNFLATIPAEVTHETLKPFTAEAYRLFHELVTVVDKRKTLQEVTALKMERELIEAQRQAERDQWRAEWCQDKPVNRPDGMMAVYMAVTFDDSDSMTDYFRPHAHIGNDILLGFVPKGPERESTARRVLARYPELNKYNFSWHTDNYSGGSGNYLESEYTEHTEKHRAYDGRDEVSTRFMIQFSAYGSEYWPYKNYPGTVETQPEPVVGGSVSINHNQALNGIEIKFPVKPDIAILDQLKDLGFRWSKYQGIWYARYTEALMAKVQLTLLAGVNYEIAVNIRGEK